MLGNGPGGGGGVIPLWDLVMLHHNTEEATDNVLFLWIYFELCFCSVHHRFNQLMAV